MRKETTTPTAIKWETYKQAMERTGLCRSSLMKFDREGITVRVGRAVRFNAQALDEAMIKGIN